MRIAPIASAALSVLAWGGPALAQTAEVEETLARINRATALRIVDSWNGLSPAAPLIADYELRRDDGSFRGLGRFSAGPLEWGIRDSAEIVVPAAAMSRFFDHLSRIRARPGEYQPRITRTDDYPSISITLETPAGTLRIHSSSQDGDHVPWGLVVGERTYVVESPAPAKALRALTPYLKRELLSRLKKDAWER